MKQALRVADRMCVIGGGRITLQGTVGEIGHLVEAAVLEHSLGEGTLTGPTTGSGVR